MLSKWFNSHEGCRGVTLWRGKKKHVELWYCPKNYQIAVHSHPQEDIELMYVFGKATFVRIDFRNVYEHLRLNRWWFLHRFTVPAGWNHYFTVSNWPLVFINIATFKEGKTPTSASVDFLPSELPHLQFND